MDAGNPAKKQVAALYRTVLPGGRLWPWELGAVGIVILSVFNAATLLYRPLIASFLMERDGRET
jgi:hypothetical protein